MYFPTGDTSQRSRGFAVFGGGITPSITSMMDYCHIPTMGNLIRWGDLTASKNETSAFSSSTRGVWAGGTTGTYQNVDTFANDLGCDSLIYIYNKYIFNANYFTDSTNTNDTSYVLIYDTITTYDTSYVSIGVTDTLYIDISITGTPNITNTISIYPNPANNYVIINNGNYSTMTNYEIRILNSLGQEVFSNLVVVPQFIVPVSSLGAEGTYFVQVLDGDGNLVVTKYLILN